MRDDQDAYDTATTVTPSTVKAAKQKYQSIPDTFHRFERLILCYIKADQALFGA